MEHRPPRWAFPANRRDSGIWVVARLLHQPAHRRPRDAVLLCDPSQGHAGAAISDRLLAIHIKPRTSNLATFEPRPAHTRLNAFDDDAALKLSPPFLKNSRNSPALTRSHCGSQRFESSSAHHIFLHLLLRLPGLAGNFGESNLGGIVALGTLPIVRERRADSLLGASPSPGNDRRVDVGSGFRSRVLQLTYRSLSVPNRFMQATGGTRAPDQLLPSHNFPHPIAIIGRVHEPAACVLRRHAMTVCLVGLGTTRDGGCPSWRTSLQHAPPIPSPRTRLETVLLN